MSGVEFMKSPGYIGALQPTLSVVSNIYRTRARIEDVLVHSTKLRLPLVVSMLEAQREMLS